MKPAIKLSDWVTFIPQISSITLITNSNQLMAFWRVSTYHSSLRVIRLSISPKSCIKFNANSAVTWCESSMNISYREHDILVNIRLTAKSLPCEIQINTLYHYRYDILIIFVCRHTVGSRSIYRMSMLKSDAQTGSYAAAYIISGLPNFHDKTFHLVLGCSICYH